MTTKQAWDWDWVSGKADMGKKADMGTDID